MATPSRCSTPTSSSTKSAYPESTPPNAGSRSATARGCTSGALVFGRQVTADCPKTDRYKRAVCRLEVDGVDANLAQLEAGMAWHYKAYAREQRAPDRRRYAQAEDEARAKPAGALGRPGAGGALGLQEGEEKHRPLSAHAPGFGSVFHFRR
jgi:hypothetical protein